MINIGLKPILRDGDDGYNQHKTYEGLVGVGGNHLSYDFYVKVGNKCWLIEYQGQQHYWPVDYFGGQSMFEIQQIHDARKYEYAECNGIPLIRISYEYNIYDKIASFLRSCGIS